MALRRGRTAHGRRRRSLILLWPAITLSLADCGTLSQTSALVGDRVYLTHTTFRENVDDIVRHYMQQKPVPGISIAIIHRRGPAQFYAYGVTDRVAGQQITWQVGYIGGYASFIGYDRANGNAIVLLQNGATIQALRCWSIWQLRIEWSDSNRRVVKRIASSFLTLSFDERGTVSL